MKILALLPLIQPVENGRRGAGEVLFQRTAGARQVVAFQRLNDFTMFLVRCLDVVGTTQVCHFIATCSPHELANKIDQFTVWAAFDQEQMPAIICFDAISGIAVTAQFAVTAFLISLKILF